MDAPNKLKYFLYARKSTESDDRQAASIDDQITEMQRLAQHLNLDVVDIVRESCSAKKPGRPAFNKMIERIHCGEGNAILCWKLNRLARNPIDGGQISWMLQQGLIKQVQTYSSEFKPTDNVIIMQVEFGQANQYIKDLSVDTRRGMRNKARRGWYPSSSLVPGYKHNELLGGDEVVPDENFVLVSELWSKMLTGVYSIPDLKREGDRLGLRNRNGHYYSLNNYRAIFTNEFYCGWFTWRNEDGLEERIRGKHRPMISESDFNLVQMVLGKRGRPTRINKYNFPFRTSHLHCGECGRAITAERKIQVRCTQCRRKFSVRARSDCPKCHADLSDMHSPRLIDRTYYTCARATKGLCPQRSAVEERELEEQIAEALDFITIPKDFHEWAADAIRYLNEQEGTDRDRQLSDLRRRETVLLQRLDQLALMRANEEISAERLARLTDEAERDLSFIRRELDPIHAKAIDWVHIVNRYLTFAETARERFVKGDADEKRTVLEGLSPNLTLKDKKLTISWPEPLLGIRTSYKAMERALEESEPAKRGQKEGLYRGVGPNFEAGLPALHKVRTAIIEMEFRFAPSL